MSAGSGWRKGEDGTLCSLTDGGWGVQEEGAHSSHGAVIYVLTLDSSFPVSVIASRISRDGWSLCLETGREETQREEAATPRAEDSREKR